VRKGRRDAIRRLKRGWGQWLTSIILAIWETEIRKISVQTQPRQILCKTLSPK
jgi:hypothetical protein